MSEYLYLFRGGVDSQTDLSPDKMQAHLQKWTDWMDTLIKQGKMAGGKRLGSEGKVAKNQSIVTDGPFAEGKEIVAGYMLINAKDLAEAVTISQGCPILQVGGTVEIRETIQQ